MEAGFPPARSPGMILVVRTNASAGVGRSEKHALGLDPRDHAQTKSLFTARETVGLRRSLLELRAFEQPLHAAQFGQRLVGLTHLLFEQRDLPQALVRRQLQGMLGSPPGLRLDHLADLGEREAELLAFQDEREPVAVRAAEDALA